MLKQKNKNSVLNHELCTIRTTFLRGGNSIADKISIHWFNYKNVVLSSFVLNHKLCTIWNKISWEPIDLISLVPNVNWAPFTNVFDIISRGCS